MSFAIPNHKILFSVVRFKSPLDFQSINMVGSFVKKDKSDKKDKKAKDGKSDKKIKSDKKGSVCLHLFLYM